ncbi:leucine-rich repeat domain-containing protein [Hymenobacter cellulosilyticus]|uniref:Leucine-rich repeat domain-containing protein n=1 Tax=Hymenobacter cellulosilyticus TaxID=2932248 RepID=A0A8T9Q4M3_9BACT|nr:leucine-rich repeat domain-containing protein [Hymenobacter cellulosilyticus]UOQ71381.1 leucine-rich repeat domain-containing protein [Hymenobacter cellulosilyticus]
MSSCLQNREAGKVLDNNYTFDTSLIKGVEDSLSIKQSTMQGMYKRCIRDADGFCKIYNDTIMLFSSSGIMTTKKLVIKMNKGKFYLRLNEFGCTYNRSYTPIDQRMVLNKRHYNVGDTIIGKLYFKSVAVLDSIQHLTDTITVTGKFKFKVRDKSYTFDILHQERSYDNFLKLARSRPDTVVSISLIDCGLKKLPDQLRLFSNIKSLYLDDNDLSNADLSMISRFKHLKYISIRGCGLKVVPNSVLGLTGLEEINVWNNDIRHLPIGLFSLPNLRYLQLGNNSLTQLPNEILNTKKLEVLEISGNTIRKLPKHFFERLAKLKEFYPPEVMDAYEYKEFKINTPDT